MTPTKKGLTRQTGKTALAEQAGPSDQVRHAAAEKGPRVGPIAWGLFSVAVLWFFVVLGRLPLFDFAPWVVGAIAVALFSMAGYWAASTSGRLGDGGLAGLVAGLANGGVLAAQPDLAPLLSATTSAAGTAWFLWLGLLGPLVVVAGLLGLLGGVAGRSLRDSTGLPKWVEQEPLRAAMLTSLVLLFVSGSAFTGGGEGGLSDWQRSVARALWPLVAWTELFPVGAVRWLDALAGILALAWAWSRFGVGRVGIQGRAAALAAAGLALYLIESVEGGVLAGFSAAGDRAPSEFVWLGLDPREWLYWLARPGFLLAMTASAATLAASTLPVRRRDSVLSTASRRDRVLAAVVVVLFWLQATLGGVSKLNSSLQVFHMLLGATVVLPVVVHASIRGWLFALGRRRVVAMALGIALTVQVTVGLLAYAVPGAIHLGPLAGLVDLTLTTIHQGLAAVLLGLAAALWAWSPDDQRDRRLK